MDDSHDIHGYAVNAVRAIRDVRIDLFVTYLKPTEEKP